MNGRTCRSGCITILSLQRFVLLALFRVFRSSNTFKYVPGSNCRAKNVMASPDEFFSSALTVKGANATLTIHPKSALDALFLPTAICFQSYRSRRDNFDVGAKQHIDGVCVIEMRCDLFSFFDVSNLPFIQEKTRASHTARAVTESYKVDVHSNYPRSIPVTCSVTKRAAAPTRQYYRYDFYIDIPC